MFLPGSILTAKYTLHVLLLITGETHFLSAVLQLSTLKMRKKQSWKLKWHHISCCSSEHPAALSVMRKTLLNMAATVYGAAVFFRLTLHINT